MQQWLPVADQAKFLGANARRLYIPGARRRSSRADLWNPAARLVADGGGGRGRPRRRPPSLAGSPPAQEHGPWAHQRERAHDAGRMRSAPRLERKGGTAALAYVQEEG